MVDERVNLDLQSAFGASLVGLRPKDEDYILGKSMNTAAGEVMDIAILLDGMGGGAAGERASESAGLAFADAWMLVGEDMAANSEVDDRHEAWGLCVQAANMVVEQISADEGARSGSTLTAITLLKTEGGEVKWADIIHVGDTRAYRFRGDDTSLLSHDHSITGDMVREGYIELHEVEETHGHNVLTMSLGGPEELIPQVEEVQVGSGDLIILCCDGIWGPLHKVDGFWFPESWSLEELPKGLAVEALARGSKDNCSAIVWLIQ